MWRFIAEIWLTPSRRTADRELSFRAMNARMTAATLSAGQRHRLIRAVERPDGLVLVRGKGPVQIKLRAAGITAAFGDCVDVCTPLGLEVRAVCLADPFLSRQKSADVRRRQARAKAEGIDGRRAEALDCGARGDAAGNGHGER